jgi:acyl-CoA thioesterase-2
MRAEELLGLEVSDDGLRSSYELVPHRCRTDGALYGGSALGASLQAFEAATGRPALWATTQFSGKTQLGARIDQEVEVLALGHNVAQLRLTARTGDDVLYSALGATARPRTGPAGDATGTGPTMPEVPPASSSDNTRWHAESGEVGFGLVSDFRAVPYPPDPITGAERPGRLAMWARLRGERHNTAASLAFLADMVPIAICHATGKAGGGTSLDNTLRVGRLVESEWVLLDIEGQHASGGYGHGQVHVWSADGQLMATGSQSSPLIVFPDGWPSGHGPG